MARRPFTDDFVAFGENPGGFTAVTANGVSHDQGDGMNHQEIDGPSINGRRWTIRDEPTIIPPHRDFSSVGIGGTKRSLKGVMRNRTGG